MAGTPVPADPRPRDRVRVRLRGTDGTRIPPSTQVVLTLRRRTGTPGANLGDPLGEQVGGGAQGPRRDGGGAASRPGSTPARCGWSRGPSTGTPRR